MLSSPLLEAVFRTVSALPPDSIKNAAATLAAGDTLSASELRNRVLGAVALPQERAVLSTLLKAREREVNPVPPPHLSAALEAALFTRTSMESASQSEMVWTGPASGMMFRRTDQALFEVINGSQHELLLVTFAAYNVPRLRDAVRHALDRGVTVSFLGESTSESGGKVSFDAAKALGSISQKILFYVWPREKRTLDASGKPGTLHAKCAIADKKVLLVSSANLTEHALQLNIEMGLLIRGGRLPEEVDRMFQKLIDAGDIRLASAQADL